MVQCIKRHVQVLTSYAVLESCFRKERSGFKRQGAIVKEKSPLHAIKWNRIIVRISYQYVMGPRTLNISCSWTKHTTSRNGPLTLPKQLSSWRLNTVGVFPALRSRIASESCTVLYASWAATHSRTTSVSGCFAVSLLRDSEISVGKECDCKSLHWRFKDHRTCDGKSIMFVRSFALADNMTPRMWA